MKPIWGMLPTKALNSVSRGSTQRAVRSKKSLRNGDLSFSVFLHYFSLRNQSAPFLRSKTQRRAVRRARDGLASARRPPRLLSSLFPNQYDPSLPVKKPLRQWCVLLRPPHLNAVLAELHAAHNKIPID
jgi:hypothetical protein